MPNHTQAEKTRIRDLVTPYLPSGVARMDARQDCPFGTLHVQQASYGQKNFANVGIVFEFCPAKTKCQYHRHPLTLQMSVEKRVDLLSELESLDPPPYHDPANTEIARSVRNQILLTGNPTSAYGDEDPSTPVRGRLSHLALQSLARSASSSFPSSASSAPSPSTQPSSLPSSAARGASSQASRLKSAETKSTTPASPDTSASASSKPKGPGRPKRGEFEVTVYGYLRDGEPLTTAKAVGYLTARKQVQFKFWQDAIAKAFGFDLDSTSRPKFHQYLPLVDEWTDRLVPLILVRGQPVLVRRENVRNMPTLDHLKPLLNPPFNPNGVRPLRTLLDHCLGFPSGSGRSASEPAMLGLGAPSDAKSTFADIFGGPPPPPSDAKESSRDPSRKRKHEDPVASSSRKTAKSSSRATTRARVPTADDVIIISDSELTVPAKEVKDDGHPDPDEEATGPSKGKGKPHGTISWDDVIDLTI